jgi:hypothetical protein
MNCSKPTAVKAVSKLEQLGAIVVFESYGQSGRRSNHYIVKVGMSEEKYQKALEQIQDKLGEARPREPKEIEEVCKPVFTVGDSKPIFTNPSKPVFTGDGKPIFTRLVNPCLHDPLLNPQSFNPNGNVANTSAFAPPPLIHNKQKENQPENESTSTPIQVDVFEESSAAAAPVAAAPSEKPTKQKKELSPHQQVMAAYQDALGYKIPNGAKEGVAAKKIVNSEYTIEQMTGCYEKMKRDPFWRDKHLSLYSVYEQLGAYCQNGHGANGHKILDATAETARLNAHLPPL